MFADLVLHFIYLSTNHHLSTLHPICTRWNSALLFRGVYSLLLILLTQHVLFEFEMINLLDQSDVFFENSLAFFFEVLLIVNISCLKTFNIVLKMSLSLNVLLHNILTANYLLSFTQNPLLVQSDDSSFQSFRVLVFRSKLDNIIFEHLFYVFLLI